MPYRVVVVVFPGLVCKDVQIAKSTYEPQEGYDIKLIRSSLAIQLLDAASVLGTLPHGNGQVYYKCI